MMAKSYNLQTIRTLLTEGFTAEELRRFCYDNPNFRPVYDELAYATGKAAIIDRLLEYGEHKELLDILLTWAKEQNPSRFAKHQPYHSFTSPTGVREGTQESSKLSTTEPASGVNIGNVEGGIHGSVIAGRDVVNPSTPITSSTSATPYSTQEVSDIQKVIKSRLYDWKWIVGTLIAIIGCIGTWLAVPGILTLFQTTVTPGPTAPSPVVEVNKIDVPLQPTESSDTPVVTAPPPHTSTSTSISQSCDDFNGEQIDENKWQFEEKPNVIYVQNGTLNFDVTAEQSESGDIGGRELVRLPVGRPIKEISFTTTLVSYERDVPGGAGFDIYLEDSRAFSMKVGPGDGPPGIEFSICRAAPCSENYADNEHSSGGPVPIGFPIPMQVVWTGQALQFYIDRMLRLERPAAQTPITKFQLSMYADPGSEFHLTVDDVCVIYVDN